mmetsp:Transcript_36793/g.115614  ORF Transcript_36793/g.115614 Transcript_36793/m.115614 type:complete len:394 (-) Transcript_36793:544-1725(-)
MTASASCDMVSLRVSRRRSRISNAVLVYCINSDATASAASPPTCPSPFPGGAGGLLLLASSGALRGTRTSRREAIARPFRGCWCAEQAAAASANATKALIPSKRLTRRPARAAHTEASCARLSGFRGPVGGERVPAAPRRGAGPILSHCASRAAVAAALCRRSSGRPLGSAALSLREGLAHPRRLEWLCGYLAGSPRTRLARRAFLRLPSAACASLVGAVGTRRLPRALARPAECGRVSCARAPRAPSTACAHARLLPCASVRAAIVSSPSPPSPALPSPPPPCRLRPHGHRGAHRHPLRRPPAPAVAPPASQPTATEPAPAFATTTLATTAPATAQHVYRRLSSARVPVPPWHRRDHGPRCGVVLVVACCGAGIQQQSNVCCRLRARRCVGR